MGRVRWIVYPPLLVIAAVVLGFRFGMAPSSHVRVRLAGKTEERLPVSLTLDSRGRIQALSTRIVALCDNGWTWSTSWSPDTLRIPFRRGPLGTGMRETQDATDREGNGRHIVVWGTAQLGDHGITATGDARVTASFSYPGGRRVTCDSGYVHWTASRRGRSAPSYGPPASSLAVSPSRARVAFAARVDEGCRRSGYEIDAAQRAARARYAGRRDERWAVYAAYLGAHADEYLALRRLGAAPEADALYEAYIANMRRRVELERTWLIEATRGQNARAARTGAKINFLKVEGNAVAQEFGLRLCTENGRLLGRAADLESARLRGESSPRRRPRSP